MRTSSLDSTCTGSGTQRKRKKYSIFIDYNIAAYDPT